MRVSNFLTLFKVRTKGMKDMQPMDAMSIVSDLIHPKSYLPFDEKCKIVQQTINSTEDGFGKTARRYRTFIINLINNYTSLEVDKNGFDDLSESKLIDIILACFESEYKLCDSIMIMCLDEERGV